jgi:predicted phage terminase large subunit-like protein
VGSIVELYNKHLDAVAILVEDKANGPGVISMLRNEVPRIIAINPTDSKFARAQTGAISIEAGNVHFPQYSTDPWAKEVYEEMRVFPSGANDDDVDCWSQFEGYVFLGQKTVTAKRMKSTGGLL